MSGQQNEMRVSVDGTRLLLKINGEFSAAGVQELLARIGGARAERIHARIGAQLQHQVVIDQHDGIGFDFKHSLPPVSRAALPGRPAQARSPASHEAAAQGA